jgi:hypothetical protein
MASAWPDPSPALKLRDTIDQVDNQRVLSAPNLGQQLNVPAQLVPRVLLADFPRDGLRRTLGPLGHGRGLLDAVLLSGVRQSLARSVGERTVVFGVSQWLVLPGPALPCVKGDVVASLPGRTSGYACRRQQGE